MRRGSVRYGAPWFAAVEVRRDVVGFHAKCRIHKRGGNYFSVNVVLMAVAVLSLANCMIAHLSMCRFRMCCISLTLC